MFWDFDTHLYIGMVIGWYVLILIGLVGLGAGVYFVIREQLWMERDVEATEPELPLREKNPVVHYDPKKVKVSDPPKVRTERDPIAEALKKHGGE